MKENITDKNPKRSRAYKRGIRSEVATDRRKTKHLMKQSEGRREHRKQQSETSRGDWRRLATKARQFAKQLQKRLLKTSNEEQQNSPENTTHTQEPT